MKRDIKLLATLGPSSFDKPTIVKLDELGVDIFRINLSHTKIEDLEDLIRKVGQYTNKPICLDSEGAQVRTGFLGKNGINLEQDSLVKIMSHCERPNSISLTPEFVVDQLKEGDLISIDFDSALLLVSELRKGSVLARVVSGGNIASNKAVTIDRHIDLPVVSKKDKAAIKIGNKLGIRHYALSFANSKEAVTLFRRLTGKGSYIISKIESKEGVENLDEIMGVSDAILIDRGDLSREEPIEKIPFLQKLIIKKANEKGINVYVATNLLESMTKAKLPTRAEASDVINALMDGADGLVLAAETAIGDHPVICATMVKKLINQYYRFRYSGSLKEMQRKESFLLVEPHGGLLVNRLKEGADVSGIKKSLTVDITDLLNAEQIAIGTFSPLEGFMNKNELESVLKNYRLPNNLVWPLPIVLQASREQAKNIHISDIVRLVSRDDAQTYALINVEEVYAYDLDKFCRKVFGTLDKGHPGVDLIKSKGNYFIAGKINLIKRLPSEYKHYEITPKQARAIFENRGWSRVVGFHTRNVIHRAHEHIQMLAMNKYHCDGLFAHPVVGPKKKGDYRTGAIVKSYELMIEKFYPKTKTLLAAFQSYSRYAGPREAVFTALCRKNFGCSHFIVGRDHTGVGNYYGPNDSHNLFEQLGDIGIKPIFFKGAHYCRKCKAYVEKCSHGPDDILSISASLGREMLKSNKTPPAWFMRTEISNSILNQIKKGEKVFI